MMSKVCQQGTILVAIPVINGISILLKRRYNIHITLFHRFVTGQVLMVIAMISFLSLSGKLTFTKIHPV